MHNIDTCAPDGKLLPACPATEPWRLSLPIFNIALCTNPGGFDILTFGLPTEWQVLEHLRSSPVERRCDGGPAEWHTGRSNAAGAMPFVTAAIGISHFAVRGLPPSIARKPHENQPFLNVTWITFTDLNLSYVGSIKTPSSQFGWV
jgi:hypothetical protein